ncbi:ribosome-releasing factor 2, mitochondrial [Pectinophora gossypiella]|uniref:ribosome-releasing factor 2, mitochondrial n=1 Tax=Pectinophora gossypiella TaxID=13191 RepID=UPI00214E1BE7|nr:ribosome-releasing factor 2, mitochondrial [Pectinophora gossypiella]
MKTFRFVKFYRKLVKHGQLRRYCNNADAKSKTEIEKIRNIGILAHIDAGKTTTTERMLFYSGTIRSMGEVHHGNTVTDYMEQERQRGITITSAAVSFPWHGSQINLIDTPGHIDFTMEVEQSLAVLDGAVVVLDASAGVEAQTLTVWRQAAGYRVPRLLYLNKMDRSDADVQRCVRSVQDRLHAQPVLLHLPVVHEDRLIGLIDLVTREEIIWTHGRGQSYTRRKLTERDGKRFEETLSNHRQLVDTLSSLDDTLADTIIQQESLDNLKSEEIDQAIRRCTIDMKAFPILCGSSYKNIGVQTLMDAVVSYLPSPLECNRLYKTFGSDLSARAFKVQHDDQGGVLTFLRLYSGELCKGQRIYNLAKEQSEQTGAVYVALADEYQPVEKVTAGNIAVVSALKTTMTGDLVTSTQAAASRAKTQLATLLKDPQQVEQLMLPSARLRLQNLEAEPTSEELASVLLGIGTTIPDPVFLCSIEPPSAAYQPALETALAELQREDPSLRVSTDEESGQIVLAGMGELHLEIIKERIIREYKIEVELGPLQIAYRESLVGRGRHSMAVDRKIGSARQMIKLTLSALTERGVAAHKVLKLDKSPESAANLAHLHPRCLATIKQGVATALLHGPKLGCPMLDVQVTLHWFEVGRGTSDSVIAATVVQCLRKVFEQAESVLLEPVMSVQVVSPESHSARVLADLGRRRALVQHITIRHHNKVIDCLAPLSELLGYSSTLRSLSSGLASFTMEFHSHQQMSPHDEEEAVRRVTGF